MDADRQPPAADRSADIEPESAPSALSAPSAARRSILLAGLGLLLGGCGVTGSGGASAGSIGSRLPSPPWDLERPGARGGHRSGSASARAVTAAPPVRLPGISGLRPRSAWGAKAADTSDMVRMSPIRAITIHHDGVRYTGRTESAARSRMRDVQRWHHDNSWADIGYHFVVDRRGVIWQGRSIEWQGAHVKDQNPGNVGVMAMGDFEQQAPTAEQVRSVAQVVRELRRTWSLQPGRVRTHRELAATACPGRAMQERIEDLRRRGAFA